jgi:hypothetical protein
MKGCSYLLEGTTKQLILVGVHKGFGDQSQETVFNSLRNKYHETIASKLEFHEMRHLRIVSNNHNFGKYKNA